jgi:hypothetical protein
LSDAFTPDSAAAGVVTLGVHSDFVGAAAPAAGSGARPDVADHLAAGWLRDASVARHAEVSPHQINLSSAESWSSAEEK